MEKIITQCSGCQTKFKLGGDKAGKKIRCPKCKSVFVVVKLANFPTVSAKPVEEKPKSAPSPVPPAAEEPAAPRTDAHAPAVEQELVPLKDRARPLQVKDFFETQQSRFIPEKAEGVNAHISYTITGDGGGEWTLIVDNGTCTIRPGSDPGAKSHARMSSKTYLKLAQGKLDGRVAFMLGKIKIKGDKASLATVRECFKVPEV
ncbi:hypothetical protein CSB45_08840 [candidate division KSB3 bacterium]|uniref:SCP2 domain-containing protein n=1 Tax=candidate division KSB3 bacterium TaxID=2044937 RepID=A0A2G6E5H9_9BACT|nr:MAG: hypothetical protein CSB45_08840 [candidate division KSB3 bacterium]PIE29723.1 MAG: hypothetical protein CSA57_07590 [candidate division KSB3 bacterium]